jgi:hypothetical protein
VIPDRRALSGVMKIFVRTGPEYVGEVVCTEERLIEVDLVRPAELAAWGSTFPELGADMLLSLITLSP